MSRLLLKYLFTIYSIYIYLVSVYLTIRYTLRCAEIVSQVRYI